MILSKTILFLAGCSALLLAPALQTHALPIEDDEDTFRILRLEESGEESFLQESIEDSFPTDIRYESKQGEIQIKVGTRRLSKDYPMPQSSKLELYRWLPIPPGSPPETLPVKQILAQIPFRNADKQMVFIGTNKQADAPFPIRGLAINDDDESHLPGQARLINLSSFGAAMALEKERVDADPRTADARVQFAPGMTDIMIAIEVNEKGSWAKASSRKLRLNGKLKLYAILYDHPPTQDDPLPVRSQIFSERVKTPSTPINR